MPNSHSNTSPQPRAMSDDTRRSFLHSDREDLLAVLTLRFGSVPTAVQERIAACDNPAALERWILVAANVPDWVSFLHDLDAGPHAFRQVGAHYESHPTAFPSESGSGAPPREPREPREPRLADGARPKEQ